MLKSLKNTLRNASASKAAERLAEEELYLKVVEELSRGVKRDGLWAMAHSDSAGSEEAAKALYIKYRVQAIKDEATLVRAAVEEAEERSLKEAEEKSESEAAIVSLKEDMPEANDNVSESVGRSDAWYFVGFWVLIFVIFIIVQSA